MRANPSVISLFSPSDSDWVTTIRTRDGRVLNQRISPGSMTEDEAMRMSVRTAGLAHADVLDCFARRVGDSSVVSSQVEDHFERLMRRLR
jgi:hypothetical protein